METIIYFITKSVDLSKYLTIAVHDHGERNELHIVLHSCARSPSKFQKRKFLSNDRLAYFRKRGKSLRVSPSHKMARKGVTNSLRMKNVIKTSAF